MSRTDPSEPRAARRRPTPLLPAVVALAMAAVPAASAQVPGVESFVRAPKTPLDFWEIADYLVRTGRADQAVPYLQKFEAGAPDDATLLRLRDEYGDASILRLVGSPATRPFADRLLPRLASARRKQANDPARIAAAVADLSKTRAERDYAVERLREAGAFAVPPLLKALGDPGASRDAIVSGLGALGDAAVSPLVAALHGPEVAGAAAQALGAIGDRRAVPPLTALAATPGGAGADAARAAVARISGVAFEAQPNPPVRVLVDAAWRAHRAVGALPEEAATGWAWDDAAKAVVPRSTTHRRVESDAGLALARAAVAIAPTDREAQVALLSLALDRDPTAAAPVALASGPAILGEVARRAIADDRPTLAVAAIAALGKVTDRKAIGEGPGRGVLVDALAARDRRVQFAAAEAMVNLDPPRAFSGSSLVVTTLARFISPGTIPRALVIDGNPARGSQTVGFLKLIGYDAQLAATGDDGFRVAAESADIELIALDPDLVLGSWRLHDTLSNLRADARTAGIPVFIVGPLAFRDKLAPKLESFPDVQFLVSPTETAIFKAQIDRGLAAARAHPLSAAERADFAVKAAGLLARIASKPGNPFEPDLAAAGPALAIALNSPATAPSALKVLADIPGSEAQRGLADILVDPARPVDLRLVAADGLARSIRHFGALLAAEQEVKLVAALDRETDPALRTALATVVGALKPKAASTARRLQAFRPTSLGR